MVGDLEVNAPMRRIEAPRIYGRIASKLQGERIRRGWTQRHLGAFVAAVLGRGKPFSCGYIARIEILDYPPPPELLRGLAIVFGESTETILGWLAPVESRETAA